MKFEKILWSVQNLHSIIKEFGNLNISMSGYGCTWIASKQSLILVTGGKNGFGQPPLAGVDFQLGDKFLEILQDLVMQLLLLEMGYLQKEVMMEPSTVFLTILRNKTEVESVQLGNMYIDDMDKCPQDKCCWL